MPLWERACPRWMRPIAGKPALTKPLPQAKFAYSAYATSADSYQTMSKSTPWTT